MSPENLQIAVLIATGAVAALVPLLIVLLASRIRNAAHESTHAALMQSTRKHEQTLAEFTRQYDRSIAEFTRENERAIATYARQHERALAELGAEHKRIAQEFGMFSQKRHEVYARLYARYRRATHDLAAVLTGQEPEFQKFSRDDLLGYLKRRGLREREAADAIGSMDRGDLFAMSKLMSKLHWRVTMRDANAAFERAREFEALNELYLSDAVREAVGNVRRKVETLSESLLREQERADKAKRIAKQDELHSSVASLLSAMRGDLGSAGANADGRPKPRPELDRTPPRGALPPRTGLADKAAPALADLA
jgi:hypothetical protein